MLGGRADVATMFFTSRDDELLLYVYSRNEHFGMRIKGKNMTELENKAVWGHPSSGKVPTAPELGHVYPPSFL